MMTTEQQMSYTPYLLDSSEPSNCEAFKRLPVFFQEYIAHYQIIMQIQIKKAFEDNTRNVVFTSAFRSPYINKQCGGVADSLHLHGLACDFVFEKKFGKIRYVEKIKDMPRCLTESFQIFFEKNHYHCQYIRGR